MVCPVNFVKKIIPILILVSLTVSVIAIMSQHVTFALYFLPLNNTLINQEGENVTNRTIPAGPAPAPTNNQTTLALPAGPAPAPTNNQTTLAIPAGPAPAPTNNQTTLALPAGPAPAPTNNQTTLALPAGPAPAPTNNQTTLALPAGPAPAPTNNQTTLALPAGPAPAPTNNQTTLALPAGPAPAPTNNQTTLALPAGPTNNPSLLSYIDPTFKFKISYPSNLTKYGVLNLNIHKTTNIGHESLGEVAFGLPKSSGTFLTISFGKEPGNFLLKDYVAAEINFLSRYMGFKQVES